MFQEKTTLYCRFVKSSITPITEACSGFLSQLFGIATQMCSNLIFSKHSFRLKALSHLFEPSITCLVQKCRIDKESNICFQVIYFAIRDSSILHFSHTSNQESSCYEMTHSKMFQASLMNILFFYAKVKMLFKLHICVWMLKFVIAERGATTTTKTGVI